MLCGSLRGDVRDGFCLTPGFCLSETTVAPDEDGRFAVRFVTGWATTEEQVDALIALL